MPGSCVRAVLKTKCSRNQPILNKLSYKNIILILVYQRNFFLLNNIEMLSSNAKL